MFNRIKSQPLGLSLSPFGFSRKCNGAGAQIFGDVFGGLAGMWSTDQANQTNKQIADNQYWYTKDLNKENRDWQSEENKQARQWQEEMYNLYNSPSAMMRQYREAGLNPYMVGQGGFGSGGSAPTSPAMSGSPSAGGVSMGHPAVPYDFSFVGRSIRDYLDAKQVSANTANQQAQTVLGALDVYRKARENNMSKESAWKMLEISLGGLSKDISSLGVQETTDMIELDYASKSLHNQFQQITNEIADKWGRREAQLKGDALEQSIVESTARIGKLASDSRVNDSIISKNVSEIVRNFADAYKLRKEGDKYAVEAWQLKELTDAIKTSYILANGRNAIGFLTDSAIYGSKRSLFDYIGSSEGQSKILDMWKEDNDPVWHALEKVNNETTKYFKVNIGASSSSGDVRVHYPY